MNADFCFHNIGQGGFYSGCIESDGNSFVFVYDCGTLSGHEFVTNAVARFDGSIYGKNKLDLLVLSHMDADHVNGVSDLLDGCNIRRINILVMPYMILMDRVMLLAYYAKRKDDDDSARYYEFLINPVGFFADRDIRVDYIVYLNDEENNHEPYILPFDHPECKFSGRENKEKEETLRNENSQNGLVSRLYCVENFKIIYRNKWKFEFWCDSENINRNIYAKVMDKIIELGLDIQDIESVKKVFKHNRKALAECYGETKIKPNDMSVVLLHYPIVKTSLSDMYVEVLKPFSYGCLFLPVCCQLADNCNSLNKTLLLGDIDLSKTLDRIWMWFNLSDIDNKILVCTVPHHGSRHSWDPNIIDRCENTIFVVSSGIHGRFKHPHRDVVEDFENRCDTPLVWNNEYEMVHIMIR